jgi:hypothetical protein
MNELEEKQSSALKTRHGCLTGFLAVAVLINAGLVLFYLAVTIGLTGFTGPPPWVFPVLALVAAVNVAAAVAIYGWKKWGFYAFLATSLFMAGLNLYLGVGPIRALAGLIGVALLYGVLRIGGKNRAWDRLE